MIAYAAEKPGVAAAQGIIARLNDAIIFPLITLGIAVAAVVFAVGVFNYVKGEKGLETHAKGAAMMMWGIIGFTIMVSARAILSFASGTFWGTFGF